MLILKRDYNFDKATKLVWNRKEKESAMVKYTKIKKEKENHMSYTHLQALIIKNNGILLKKGNTKAQQDAK